MLIGTIITAHGIHGQVKIKSYIDNPRDIEAYGPLWDKTGERQFSLSIISDNGDVLIATIAGVNDRNSAELLRNTNLYISRSALPVLAKGSYYQADLIGMRVVREDKTVYGTVKNVLNYGAGDIIEIARVGKDTELVPFSIDFFPRIDEENRSLTIHPPEYMEGEKNS